MMKQKIITICCCITFLFIALFAHADEDCDLTLRDAKTAYNAGNYTQAKKLFDYVVTICGSSYGSAGSWSQKCQEALTPQLTVSRSNISVSAYSGSTSLTVTSNRSWKLANTNSSLFTISKNGDKITINYSANPNTTSRSDYFDVLTTDGSKSIRIFVTQEAKVNSSPYLTVNKTSISAPSSGTTENITVSSNVAWEVQYPSASMYSVTRSGNTLTVTINANTSTDSRTDYFNVKTSDGSIVQKISLSQSGKSSSTPYISVSKTSISAPSSGTTENITVSSNVAWEVQYPSASMYSVTRSGNTLTVTINANTSTDSRTDYFNVKTSDGSKVQKISLSQSGKSYSTPYISVNKTSISAPSSGTTETITVSCNVAWEVQYPSASMYSVTRSGNTLTVTINANTSTESRTDYFNIKTSDGSKIQKISLSQSGKSSSSNNSYATINNITVDHNVYQDGLKGMKIHVKFDAYSVYQHSVKVCVYFYYQNGNALKGISGSNYVTTNGNVTIQEAQTAPYTNTTWNDFIVFMPYSYLNMASGCKDVSLEGHVGIHDDTTDKWLTAEYKNFYFTYSN